MHWTFEKIGSRNSATLQWLLSALHNSDSEGRKGAEVSLILGKSKKYYFFPLTQTKIVFFLSPNYFKKWKLLEKQFFLHSVRIFLLDWLKSSPKSWQHCTLSKQLVYFNFASTLKHWVKKGIPPSINGEWRVIGFIHLIPFHLEHPFYVCIRGYSLSTAFMHIWNELFHCKLALYRIIIFDDEPCLQEEFVS